MFVAAMNPCPCGYYPSAKCRCSDYEIIHYRGKVSGPILERIDIQKQVRHVDYFELDNNSQTMTSAEIRKKVENARYIQQERFKEEKNVYCNAQMTTSMIKRFCKLDEESTLLLKNASENAVWLTQISGIGTVAQHKLLKEVGSAKDIYEGVSSGQYQGVYSKKLKNNLNLDAAKTILEDCAHNKIKILTMEEGKLPDRFEKHSDLPILLYAKGIDIPLEYGTGIVGARRCSSESKIASIMLAQKEILRGRIIVSGMAKGIDSYAHTAAIKEGGTTIAVDDRKKRICKYG